MALLVVAFVMTTGCQRLNKTTKHWESSWEGLDRTISLYTDDGELFGRWNARTFVETRPPVVAFLDSVGKEIKLMGGIVVIQER